MSESEKRPFFKLTGCTSLDKMLEKIAYVLKVREEDRNRQFCLEAYNFPAETVEHVQSVWKGVLKNYAQQNISRPGAPLKKVGYMLVLSPGISHDLFDDFRHAVNDFVDNNLMDNFLIATYHFDTNHLHAHLLIHAVTVNMRAWRMPMSDLVPFRNAWLAGCKRFGLPHELDVRNDRPRAAPKAPQANPAENSFPLASEKIHVPFKQTKDDEDARSEKTNGRRADGVQKDVRRGDRSQH